MPVPNDKSYCVHNNSDFIQNMDKDLATAWLVMSKFCLQVNLGTQTQRFISPAIICETMTAVTYRLVHMRFSAGSIDEIVRHGLLAYCYHVFLQWQDIKVPYRYFPTAYQNCILHLKLANMASDQLMLWLLMVGALSVFDVSDETWLRKLLREYASKCRVKTWKEVQDVLKSFMWIPLLDQRPGKCIFDELCLDGRDVEMVG